MRRCFLMLLVAGYMLHATSLVTYATDFSSTNFVVKDPVIKPGAGFSTSSSFQLWQSVGQEAIGLSDALDFGLKAGFLYFPAPVAPSPAPAPVTIATVGVGQGPAKAKIISIIRLCDFNNDGRCDIVDLSILLYYLQHPFVTRYDLNNDGAIDVIDLSILFFYWT